MSHILFMENEAQTGLNDLLSTTISDKRQNSHPYYTPDSVWPGPRPLNLPTSASRPVQNGNS